MAENNMSAADYAVLSNGGFGGFEGLIYLAVIASMFGGWGGGFGWGGGGNAVNALNADNQRSFDTLSLQNQTRDIMNAVTNGTAQTIAASTANATNAINAIKDGNASLIREFGTVETAITALSGKQQECCCNTLRAIDSVNYNSAVNTAAINANVTAQVQSIKDMLYAQRDQEQQARIANLELTNALAGVIRFPMQYAFNGGVFPPVTTAGA